MQPKWQSCYGGTEWDQGNSIVKNDMGYLLISSTESSDGDVVGHHGLSDSWLIQVDTIGNILWSRSYGGTKGEYGEEILKVGKNQYYLIGIGGSEDGDISFDPYPNSMDFWILKIDSVGNIHWDKILGGNKIDWTRNARITSDEGVLTIGVSTSDDGDITNPNGSWDLWLVKLNSSGETEWDFSLGGEGSQEGASINQTTDGGYIITGNTDGIGGGNYDTTCNFHGTPGGGFSDVWVVKLDSLRNIEWQQCYGGSFLDGSTNLLETNNGYVVLASTMSNDGDVSGFHGVPGDLHYGNDIWVFKIDKQGNLLWQNCLGGLFSEFARNIFPTTDGGYMIVGTTQSDDGDVEGFNGGDTGGYDDIWFAKIDSLGQLTWQYCYGGFGTEYLYRGVYQKGDYNYVLALGTKTDNWQCNINTAKPDLRIVELYDSTVGITENQSRDSGEKLVVEVSPNPAKDKISFKYSLPSNQTKAQLTIYNNTGQILRSFNVMANQGQIIYNTSGLNAGVYFYSVIAGKKNKKGKFVKR